VDGEEVDNSELMDHNDYEIGLGLEYSITDRLFVSAGYLLTSSGVTEDYQSDMSFDLSSNSVGGGFGFKLLDNLMLNAGVSYTKYTDGTKNYEHTNLVPPGAQIPTTDTYYLDALILSLGLDLSF
jgi:long-subunit fatty acid transport protein